MYNLKVQQRLIVLKQKAKLVFDFGRQYRKRHYHPCNIQNHLSANSVYIKTELDVIKVKHCLTVKQAEYAVSLCTFITVMYFCILSPAFQLIF